MAAGSAARAWHTKFALYEQHGVAEYWIVEPLARSIAAFVRDADTERYALAAEYAKPGLVPSHTLPGLTLEWADIFADD